MVLKKLKKLEKKKKEFKEKQKLKRKQDVGQYHFKDLSLDKMKERIAKIESQEKKTKTACRKLRILKKKVTAMEDTNKCNDNILKCTINNENEDKNRKLKTNSAPEIETKIKNLFDNIEHSNVSSSKKFENLTQNNFDEKSFNNTNVSKKGKKKKKNKFEGNNLSVENIVQKQMENLNEDDTKNNLDTSKKQSKSNNNQVIKKSYIKNENNGKASTLNCSIESGEILDSDSIEDQKDRNEIREIQKSSKIKNEIKKKLERTLEEGEIESDEGSTETKNHAKTDDKDFRELSLSEKKKKKNNEGTSQNKKQNLDKLSGQKKSNESKTLPGKKQRYVLFVGNISYV